MDTQVENELIEQVDNRNKRLRKLPKKYSDYEMYMAYNVMKFDDDDCEMHGFDKIGIIESVPLDYDHLNNREDKRFWESAMDKELESINKNGTWRLIVKPEKAEILDTKWVYSYKPYEENKSEQYKARLVVRGFAQKNSFNYEELYAPVAKMTTIRTLLAIGNQFGYYFKQLDVKTAFLNGDLIEDIYMYIPTKRGKL